MRLAIAYIRALIGGALLGRWISTWGWNPDKLVTPKGLDLILAGAILAIGPIWAMVERRTRKPPRLRIQRD